LGPSIARVRKSYRGGSTRSSRRRAHAVTRRFGFGSSYSATAAIPRSRSRNGDIACGSADGGFARSISELVVCEAPGRASLLDRGNYKN
jgi:hypothetical protein